VAGVLALTILLALPLALTMRDALSVHLGGSLALLLTHTSDR